jgi:hypothetical protein
VARASAPAIARRRRGHGGPRHWRCARIALRLPDGWQASGPVDLLEQPSAPKAEGWLSPFEVLSWRLRRG